MMNRSAVVAPSQKERLQLGEPDAAGHRANVEESINRFRARLFLLRQEEARQWLMDVLGGDADELLDQSDAHAVETADDGSVSDFVSKLRDGVLLCRLADTWMRQMEEGSKGMKYHRHVVKGSTMEFMRINDNINQFYDACGKIDFPKTYLFTFTDIFERRNITNVVHCIHALAHFLYRTGRCNVKIRDLSKENIEFDQAEIDRLEKEFDDMEARGNMPNLNFNFGMDGSGDDDKEIEDQSGGFTFDDDDFGDNGGGDGDFGDFDISDFDIGIDPRHCTVQGLGSRQARAGEWTRCTIVSRNQFGAEIDTGGSADDFEVYLVKSGEPDAVPIDAEVVDLGNGQYQIGYRIDTAGDYEMHVKYDRVQLRDGPYKVKVIPGSISPEHCTFEDPHALQSTEYYEGHQYQVRLIARDKFGNVCTRGGEHFAADLKLKLSKHVPTGRSLRVNLDSTAIHDNGDGTFDIRFSAPVPGMYEFSIRHGDHFIRLPPSATDKQALIFAEMSMPELHYSFDKFDPGSSVAQFSVRTVSPADGSVSDPKYVSVVMSNSFPSNLALTEQDTMQMKQIFAQQMKQWIDRARKHRVAALTTSSSGSPADDLHDLQMSDQLMDMFNGDDDDSDSGRNFYWNLLDQAIDDEEKGEHLTHAMQQEYKFANQNNTIDFVTVTDEHMDWADFEARRRQEQLERERRLELQRQMQIQQMQHQHQQKLQLQADYKWQQWNPNNQRSKPRTAALNFWIMVSHLMNEAKKQRPRIVDEHGLITQYDGRDISVRQYANPDVFYVARKSHIIQYCDMLLQVAQTYVFQLLDEIGQTLPNQSFEMVRPALMQIAKASFEEFKQSHMVWDTVARGSMYIKGGLATEIDSEMLDQANRFVQAVKRRLLIVLRDHVILKFKRALSDNLGMKDSEIDNLSLKSTYFKSQLAQIYQGWIICMSFTMSNQKRRIMVQELIFKTPFRNKLNQILTSQSYSIQVPINAFFDRSLYGDRTTNLSIRDRARKGLVNPWKSVFVKGGVVMWEGIRTASLPATGITDNKERAHATIENAIELLRVAAANHCKRFSREELNELNARGEILNVPFTSLSLLTPFFVSREDRQVMEHQSALLEVVKRGLVSEVTVDLHDGKPFMTVPVRFRDVCLLNFGTNYMIKTFKFGLGIQRAVNNRTTGMRAFEKKVIRFLQEISLQKDNLRLQVTRYLREVVFQSSRSGNLYAQSLGPRLQQMEFVMNQLRQIEEEVRQKNEVIEFKMEAKQRELENRIKTRWMPKFDSIANVEYIFQTKIRSLANELDSLHSKIYKLELKKLGEKLDEVLEIEGLFVRDVSTVLNQTTEPQHQMLSIWNEYVALFVKEKDIRQMFNDLRHLYHTKAYEAFAQGLVESKEVKQVDPYAVPVRIMLLSFTIGDQLHFCCKTGNERTGIAQDQVQEYAELRAHLNEYPNSRNEKKMFNDFRRMIFTNIALNGSSLEIIRQNVALPGSKTDATVSGRFVPGFYSRYRGLSSIAKTSFAGNDKDFDEIIRMYLNRR